MPLLFIIVLFALVGCAFESADTDVRVQTLSSDTTSTSEETVDLTVPSHAYVFEDGAALDPQLRARVTLVCPNGAEMHFDDWFGAQSEVVQQAFEGRRTSMASQPDTAIDALREEDPGCPCDIECSYCPDGSVICAFDCPRVC